MLTRLRTWVRENKPEAIAYSSAIIGWLLITLGIYILTGNVAVWFISTGFLLMGGVGLWPILSFLWDGIYATWIEDQQEQG